MELKLKSWDLSEEPHLTYHAVSSELSITFSGKRRDRVDFLPPPPAPLPVWEEEAAAALKMEAMEVEIG